VVFAGYEVEMSFARLITLIMGACILAGPVWARELGEYPLTADSLVQPGVAHGRLEGPFEFRSGVIAGTVRRYWVYVPAGYDTRRPPNLLVFQDGQRATNPEGLLRIPAVLDNLIAKHDVPPTLGLFITPGNLSEHYPPDLGTSNPNHRAQEYDALTDAYARMLIDELLPEVARRWRFSDDPKRRVIGGTSSGAIAAWTVAWNRPDAFANVISYIGSYTSIGLKRGPNGEVLAPGGDLYPGLIRKSPIRPIRVFLQDGSNDLDNVHGSWFLANQQMLSALNWANRNADELKTPGSRYDVNHVWGDGAHADTQGGAILPEVLRWIWRDQRPAAR
jgi:poly(3-hydroxybutyrate) depolymerase